jgi:hypothetical protein
MYNAFRDHGLTHPDAIKGVQAKYSGVGPVNQKRLQDQYKPVPPPSDVISSLNLNLLSKGGGDWNVDNVNMKKSVVTTFQGKTVVKAQYDKNSGTSGDPGVGGFSFVAVPDKLNKQAITFAWDVFYPKGFDFAKGGKFFGPFIGHGAASGYDHSPTGSSNRVMWQRSGGVIDYIYPPSDLKQKIPTLDPTGHGIGFFSDEFANALKYDVWNHVEVGTKMNSFKNGVAQLDGESYVVVNGKKAVLKGINWSRSPDLVINRFDANSFFGGPDPSPKSQFAYFTNFQMKKYHA